MVIAEAMLEGWNVLKSLTPAGVEPFHFYLTGLISFAIIFALLGRLKLFEGKKKINVVISLIMSYFVASSAFVTILVSKLFPNVGLVLLAVLGFLLVIGFVSPDLLPGEEGLGSAGKIGIVIAILFIIVMTWQFSAPKLAEQGIIGSSDMGVSISDTDLGIILVMLIIGGVLWAIIGGSGSSSGGSEKVFKIS